MAREPSIREIVKQRDNLNDSDVDELFEEFKAYLRDGMDPEEAITEVFGLEPDYIFDNELLGVYSRG